MEHDQIISWCCGLTQLEQFPKISQKPTLWYLAWDFNSAKPSRLLSPSLLVLPRLYASDGRERSSISLGAHFFSSVRTHSLHVRFQHEGYKAL